MSNIAKATPRSMRNEPVSLNQRSQTIRKLQISQTSKSIKKSLNSKILDQQQLIRQSISQQDNQLDQRDIRKSKIKRIPLNILKERIRNRNKQSFLLSPDAATTTKSKMQNCRMFLDKKSNSDETNLFTSKLYSAYDNGFFQNKNNQSRSTRNLMGCKQELLSLKNIMCVNDDLSTNPASQSKQSEENQIDNMLFSDNEDIESVGENDNGFKINFQQVNSNALNDSEKANAFANSSGHSSCKTVQTNFLPFENDGPLFFRSNTNELAQEQPKIGIDDLDNMLLDGGESLPKQINDSLNKPDFSTDLALCRSIFSKHFTLDSAIQQQLHNIQEPALSPIISESKNSA